MAINPVPVPSLPAENASTVNPSMSWLIYNPAGVGKKLRRLLGSEFLTYLNGLYLRYAEDQGVSNYVLATKADKTSGFKQLVASGALSISHTDSSITFTVTPGAVANATATVPGAVQLNTNGEVPPIVYRKAEIDATNAAQNATVSALTTDHNTTKNRVTTLESLNAGSRLTSLETFQGTQNAYNAANDNNTTRHLSARWENMTCGVGATDGLITGTGGNENPILNVVLGGGWGSVGQNTIVSLNAPSSGNVLVRIHFKAQFNYTLGTTRPSRLDLKLARNFNNFGFIPIEPVVWLETGNTFVAMTLGGFRDEILTAGNTYAYRLIQTNNGSGGTMSVGAISIGAEVLAYYS